MAVQNSDLSRQSSGFPKTLTFIGILCASLTLGLTLTHVLEIPGKRQLNGAEWLTVQRTFYGGFAIVGAICEILGLIICVVSVLLIIKHRRALIVYLTASLCFLGTLLSYWFGNRPINAKVASWTPATLPPDWATYRNHWDDAHAISAVFSAIAFVVLLVYVIYQKR
ncbi:DUF1772 domain-containing protein [Alicyclobacillus fodiniaquatilis]|uniref:DUF1772 domain-containing protein n=1 Tax=Alicyclobacillus fodiniaquatilis TaxID=1661150 RepID=A0ABW4JG68_9BACL